jgi:hypothetical protein
LNSFCRRYAQPEDGSSRGPAIRFERAADERRHALRHRETDALSRDAGNRVLRSLLERREERSGARRDSRPFVRDDELDCAVTLAARTEPAAMRSRAASIVVAMRTGRPAAASGSARPSSALPDRMARPAFQRREMVTMSADAEAAD